MFRKIQGFIQEALESMECTCIDCPRIGQMTLHDLNAIHPYITFVNKSNGTMIFPE